MQALEAAAPRGLGANAWGPEDRRAALRAELERAVLDLLRGDARGGIASDPIAVRLVALRRASAGGGKRHALRLQRLLSLLDSVHGLLTSGRHATPREVFYANVPLFKRQQQSNDLLKVLCCDLRVPRHYLRLVGTAKGLIRGHLKLLEPAVFDGSSDSWVDGMDPFEPRGHSISPMCAHIARIDSAARFVLVAEKETVFHRLLEDGVLEKHRPCILVTARGFPDVPTRYLLRCIQRDCGEPRVLLLVDADAFGLSIAATYAFGPQEGWMQDDLTLPNAEILVCTDAKVATQRFGLGSNDVAPLTARDEAIAHGLMKRFGVLRRTFGDKMLPWELATRLLLEGGKKYEIDALDGLMDFVSNGVEERGQMEIRARQGEESLQA